LKTSNDGTDVTVGGKLFKAAATGNAHTVCGGTFSVAVEPDLSRSLDSMSVTR